MGVLWSSSVQQWMQELGRSAYAKRHQSSHLRQPSYIYRPQRSCEGYVFTGVCLSTGGGGVSASVHAGIPHPPREQTPPGCRHPTGADMPPGSRHPPGSRPPLGGADTPRSRHPPGANTPHGSRHPPKRRPLLRTVRILLECILVSWVYPSGSAFTHYRHCISFQTKHNGNFKLTQGNYFAQYTIQYSNYVPKINGKNFTWLLLIFPFLILWRVRVRIPVKLIVVLILYEMRVCD